MRTHGGWRDATRPKRKAVSEELCLKLRPLRCHPERACGWACEGPRKLRTPCNRGHSTCSCFAFPAAHLKNRRSTVSFGRAGGQIVLPAFAPNLWDT
jgi:hypothetical protein